MQNLVLVKKMKKYALVKNNVVQSTFYSSKGPEAYPDILEYLHEIPEEVACNWLHHDGYFYPQVPAVMVKVDDGFAYVQPMVTYEKKNFSWVQAGVAVTAAALGVAAQYFLK